MLKKNKNKGVARGLLRIMTKVCFRSNSEIHITRKGISN